MYEYMKNLCWVAEMEKERNRGRERERQREPQQKLSKQPEENPPSL
jgi:hypothetical protein